MILRRACSEILFYLPAEYGPRANIGSFAVPYPNIHILLYCIPISPQHALNNPLPLRFQNHRGPLTPTTKTVGSQSTRSQGYKHTSLFVIGLVCVGATHLEYPFSTSEWYSPTNTSNDISPPRTHPPAGGWMDGWCMHVCKHRLIGYLKEA